jgi:adenylosuccinate lyase
MTNRETPGNTEVKIPTIHEKYSQVINAAVVSTLNFLRDKELWPEDPEVINAAQNTTASDGRYKELTKQLSPYVSEHAVMGLRLEGIVEYVIDLFDTGRVGEPLTEKEKDELYNILTAFKAKERGIGQVKRMEQKTRHDVNALIRWFKKQLPRKLRVKIEAYVHWGLTSEDLNNIAYTGTWVNGLKEVIMPKMQNVASKMGDFASEKPTENNKIQELFTAVSIQLVTVVADLDTHTYEGKFGGATGGLCGHLLTFPDFDWQSFGNRFLAKFGLKKQIVTTQIASPESLLESLDKLKEISVVLHTFSSTIWDLISAEAIHQQNTGGDGSSAMPNKINPISFENHMGNIAKLIGLIDAMISQLATSRMERDLTGSTVIRDLGTVLDLFLIAITNLERGLGAITIAENPGLSPILEAKVEALLTKLSNGQTIENVREPVTENLGQVRVMSILKQKALEHKVQPVLALTHGQPAIPTTAGHILAVMHSRLFTCQLQSMNIGNQPVSDSLQLMSKLNNTARTSSLYYDILRDLEYYLDRNIMCLNTDNDHSKDVKLAEYNQLAVLKGKFYYMQEKMRAVSNGILIMPSLEMSLCENELLHTEFTDLINQTADILERLQIDPVSMESELDANWAVLAEPIQLVLRDNGRVHAYDDLKKLCQGNTVTQESLHAWINGENQDFPTHIRKLLKNLTPRSYTGDSEKTVDLYFESIAV